MAGKAGRSGRRRLSVAHHLAHGTYRKDRHGPKPARAAVAIFPAPPAADDTPEQLVAGLEAGGGRFVRACWAEYRGWSAPQRLLLQRAGQLVDLEQRAREAGDTRLWMQVHKALLATVASLGLKET